MYGHAACAQAIGGAVSGEFEWDDIRGCECNTDSGCILAKAQAEGKRLEARVKVLTTALEWCVEQHPDLYGDENPEKGMPLTIVARALGGEP